MKDTFIAIVYATGVVLIMGLLIWFFIILLYMGFGPSKEEREKSHAMQVIQEIDGCKVYRFYDGDYHYVTRCGANVITRKNWDENCGKACTRHRTEDIRTEDNQ